MGAQNQLGEARDTLPLTTWASKAFLSRTEKQQRDEVCWSKRCSCADTTHMEGFSKLSLFLDGGRLTTTHQPGFFVETDGRREKRMECIVQQNGSRRGRMAEEQSVLRHNDVFPW